MPVKTKSIGIWSSIIELVSFLGVIVNLCKGSLNNRLRNLHSPAGGHLPGQAPAGVRAGNISPEVLYEPGLFGAYSRHGGVGTA